MNKEYAVKLVGGMGDIGAICFKEFEFDGSWFDSKEDAEKFKRQLEWANKNTVYEIIKEGETMNQEESVEKANKHHHPHADMIIEWAKDTSKVVEYWDDGLYCWVECNYPTWGVKVKYRFQPAKPERVFPTTSLTEDELESIYFDATVLSHKESCKYIANAAIKQYILDTEKSDDKT